MTDNSNFNLFANFPTWKTLTPKEQYDYVMADPGFQKAYLDGDMVARVTFETATKNLADHQRAEQAKELAEAIAASKAEQS
jgi:hypothetical protein